MSVTYLSAKRLHDGTNHPSATGRFSFHEGKTHPSTTGRFSFNDGTNHPSATGRFRPIAGSESLSPLGADFVCRPTAFGGTR